MKFNSKTLLLSISVILISLSCQKVISIDIAESDQKIIVEMVGKNMAGESFLNLSKSVPLYGESNVEAVSNAEVTVTDMDGESYVFKEIQNLPGRYQSENFVVKQNDFYSLSILTEEDTLSSTCRSFTVPDLQSLSYLPPSGGQQNYTVNYAFSDPVSEVNFYRANVWINGKKSNRYYLTDDELFNGEVATLGFFREQFKSGDSVYVELISMDEHNFRYFQALSSGGGNNPFSAAPANPPTNISNGIGYFGAYTVDTMSIIIQ